MAAAAAVVFFFSLLLFGGVRDKSRRVSLARTQHKNTPDEEVTLSPVAAAAAANTNAAALMPRVHCNFHPSCRHEGNCHFLTSRASLVWLPLCRSVWHSSCFYPSVNTYQNKSLGFESVRILEGGGKHVIIWGDEKRKTFVYSTLTDLWSFFQFIATLHLHCRSIRQRFCFDFWFWFDVTSAFFPKRTAFKCPQFSNRGANLFGNQSKKEKTMRHCFLAGAVFLVEKKRNLKRLKSQHTLCSSGLLTLPRYN